MLITHRRYYNDFLRIVGYKYEKAKIMEYHMN